MSKEETVLTDPNQRVCCEVSYEALLDSGYGYQLPGFGSGDVTIGSSRRNPSRDVGVFATGASLPQYLTDVMTDTGRETATMRFNNPAHYWEVEVGNDKDYTATRISYLLDLRGPSQTIQTACSSALTAVHSAVTSLRANHCEMAIVTSCSIQIPQDSGYTFQPGMVWSITGKCHPYDSIGSGTVPGNAAVAFVLKPKTEAIKDKDRIYSIIKGVGMSNDGRQKYSYNSPSRIGQVDAIQKAQRDTDPETVKRVSMIEGHGTGTAVGDPIELAALMDTYPEQAISLSSVKGHIGHANTAAGGVGLLKATLSLFNKTLLPTANYSNPVAELQNITIKTEPEYWSTPSPSSKRTCAVSSFGVGGTNVHVICEEYVPEDDHKTPNHSNEDTTLLVSAPSHESLQQTCSQYQKYYFSEEAHLDSDISLTDVQYTLSTRPEYPFRGLVSSKETLFFEAKPAGKTTVLCFPGQGGCYKNLGHNLRSQIPSFDAAFKSCETALGREITHDPQSNREEQILIFTVEYCIATVLIEDVGINPKHLMGHSLGEIVAAAVMKVFDLRTALLLVDKRGQISDSIAQKSTLGMLSVAGGTADEINTFVSEFNKKSTKPIEIACSNSPIRFVLAGDSASLDVLSDTISKSGNTWTSKKLPLKTAFHTTSMREGITPLRDFFKQHSFGQPSTDSSLLSTVTGTILSSTDICSIDYWIDHLTNKVLFSQASSIIPEGATVIECGPSILRGCLSESCKSSTVSILARPSDKSKEVEAARFWEATSQLWGHGCAIDTEHLLRLKYQPNAGEFKIQSLPPPSWNRQLCWPQTQGLTKASAQTVVPEAPQGPDVLHFDYSFNQMITTAVEGTTAADIDVVFPVHFIEPTCSAALPTGSVRCEADNVIDFVKRYRRLVICSDLHPKGVADAGASTALLNDYIDLIQKIGLLTSEDDVDVSLFLIVDADSPHYSGLVAFSRVVAKEYTSIKMTQILVRNSPSNALSIVVPSLEMVSMFSSEVLFDVSDGRWYTPCLTAPSLEPSPTSTTMPRTAAITGGTMGVGLEIACWLSAHKKVDKIFIMGRTSLSQEHRRSLSTKIQGSNHSCEVSFVIGDVSQKDDMVNLCETIGTDDVTVYHCAGVVSDQIIKNIPRDLSKLSHQVAAKIHGVQNLVEVFGEKQKTKMIICSSSSSIFAPAGQGVYAAANGYIDSCATYYTSTAKVKATILAVQWGGWNVGMSERYNIKPEPGELFFELRGRPHLHNEPSSSTNR
eukprot:TRINITY_DN5302_c0_g3_i2.p1 TRINITY_DN5302_c0_g3~~TRINITY_DN5302_c0_g3_i2.p1  ORF type:complete len:1249 (+),score=235.13 TRINITY_DN5302_c0_g3_i2:2092-5838(+)